MRAVEQRTEIGSDTWWITAAILTGSLTMAFGMFVVIVAIPKVMTAKASARTGIPDNI
jgi:hypothetical protein